MDASKSRGAYRIRRTPQACNTCRLRKTKCDGAKPQCRHCASRKVDCVWDDQERGRQRQSVSLTPTASRVGSSDLPSPSSLPRTRYLSPSTTPARPASLAHHGLVKRCFQMFIERHLANDFCSFLHPSRFEAEYADSPFLSMSIVALCRRYLTDDDVPRLLEGHTPQEARSHYVTVARAMARDASDQPSLTNIQAHLVLALAELLDDSGSGHWIYVGTAIRMAQIMRLNKEYHQGHTLEQRELRRRTFWACLLFDRLLAFLLSKPRTLSVLNIGIALPATDVSLTYQETTHGLTLGDLSSVPQRPSVVGLAPFFLKTVVLWSDIADVKISQGRFVETLLPTDTASRFSRDHEAMRNWMAALPPVLQWTRQNFKVHYDLGHGRMFVDMHLLIQSSFCVANQLYLPQTDASSVLLDTVDNAGWSFLRREPGLICAAVSGALAIGDIVSCLLDGSMGVSSTLLPSTWVSTSALSAINTLLWLRYASDITPVVDPQVRLRAEGHVEVFTRLFASWEEQWPAAKLWLRTLKELDTTYTEAYRGQGEIDVDEATEDEAAPADSENDPTSVSGGSKIEEYRPKPGDGAPPVTDVSLLSLHDSLRCHVLDKTTAAAILRSRRSTWLQLANACPTLLTDTDFEIGFDMCV